MDYCITLTALADQLGVKAQSLRVLAGRQDDPLPMRMIKGKSRGGFLILSELNEWMERNTDLYRDMEK